MAFVTPFILSVVVIFLVYIWTRNKKQKNLPPGPTPLPIIGNIDIHWKDQISEFRKFRKQYGDIYRLQLGTKTVIVANGMETLKEFLIKHGDVVSERPQGFASKDLNHNQGLISTSGPLWKEHRTFALTALRDFGFGKRNQEGKIMEEVEYFLNTVKNFDGKPFDVKGLINISVSNVICSVVFGRRYDHDDENFVAVMTSLSEIFSNAAIMGLFTFFPFLKYIPGDPLKFANVMESNRQMSWRVIVKCHGE